MKTESTRPENQNNYDMTKLRIGLFIEHEDDSSDYDWIEAWLKRWQPHITVLDYSTGGWEHYWQLEAPQQAVDEVPKNYFCAIAPVPITPHR